MDPLTLIAVAVLVVLAGWLSTHLPEPWRMMVIVVLVIAILFAILRLLGLL